jgi:multiple sugar transport system substrate-binding protein
MKIFKIKKSYQKVIEIFDSFLVIERSIWKVRTTGEAARSRSLRNAMKGRQDMKLKVTAIVTAVLVVLTMAPMFTATAASDSSIKKEINALNKSNKKFTYWIGLIYSDKANKTEVDQINAWAKTRHINANPVLVNQNNLSAQVTAALTAGTMPDAFDISSGLMLQLGSKNLLNIQNVVDELGTRYRGYNKAALQFNLPSYAGKGLGVPYGINGNLLNRRLDLIKASHGKSIAPATWEEALSTSIAAQKVGGWGFNTGNVGDAEGVFDAQLHDYGGRIANDAGTTCTIDTPATKDFLALVKKAYVANAYPSDSSNSDGSWDNNKYLGGKVVFIANPGSVYTTLIGGSATWDKNPTLAKNTGFSALPAGPVMRVAPSDAWLRTVSKTTKYPELAKDLIRYLQGFANAKAYYSQALYGPSLKAYNSFTFWRASVDPARAGLFDLATAGTAGLYPDVNNAAVAEFTGGFGISQMVQRYLYGGKTVDQTIAEAQKTCQVIYDKYQK